MAKDPNDSKTKDMTGQQYRVNFTFVDNKFNLRQGAIIVTANTPDEAKKLAEPTLRDRFETQYRITGAKPW